MSQSLPLYILAGGQSRRFGSDKARAVMHGQTLLQRVAEQLLPAVAEVWVVADRPDKYADLGLATLADPTPHRGPLNGLATALEHRQTVHGQGWLVMAPCDLATPSPRWIEPLLAATDFLAEGSATSYVDSTGRLQPLPCVVHTNGLAAAKQALDDHRLSLCRFLESVGARTVPLPEGYEAVPNANTPRELADVASASSASVG